MRRFNGAATARSRMGRLSDAEWLAILVASMGPRPLGRGWRNAARMPHIWPCGFNGAATARSRMGWGEGRG